MAVLVVDDNSVNRKVLLETLQAEGFRAFEAGDGLEALSVLARGKIDAIISDILMPRMDGYRLCYEVRRDERFRNTPFIIYTCTYTSPSDEEFARSVGADVFLRKPAPTQEIVKALRHLPTRVRAGSPVPIEELEMLQQYSQRLVKKLEEKNLELLRATQELRQTRDFCLTLLDDFPTPIWRSGADAKCDYFNHTWLKFTGRTLDEELGDGWVQGVHPRDAERVLKDYMAAFQARREFSLEYRLRRFDGVYRDIVDEGRPFFGPDNNFAGFIGSCYDITESKRSQNRIEEFARLGQKLNSAATSREAAQIIVETADQLLGWDASVFDLYAQQEDLIHPVLRMDVVGGQRVDLSKSASPQRPTARTRLVLNNGGQLLLRDAPEFDPEAQPFGDSNRPSASILTVPVRYGTAVVGILSIQSYTRNAYDQVSLDTLQALADYCGGALDRIRTVKALRDSEERFRELTENISKVFWMSDPDNTQMLYVSPAYERIWGRTCESLYRVPKSWSEAIHPEDRTQTLERLRTRAANEHDVTYRIVRPDGQVRWIRDRGFPVRNEQGQPYRMAGVAEDITDRQNTDATLREREKQLREAQRIAHAGSWHWDIRTDRVTWSEELFQIFGVKSTRFVPAFDAFLALVHPQDRAFVEQTWKAAAATLQPLDHQYRIIRPDRSVRVVRARAEAVCDERGQAIAWTGSAQDITEQNLVEEELRKSREQLRAFAARLQHAREDESLRIAREIHDLLGHALTSLSMDLAAIEDSLRKEAAPHRKLLQRTKTMTELLEQTAGTVQRIAMELRPSLLDDLGLPAALKWQVEEFGARTGIVCRWRRKPPESGGRNQNDIVAFRIFQEALTNIARHAQARNVTFDCRRQGGNQVVTIRDDGRGFDETKLSSTTSIGLLGMRERAALIGGKVDIKSVLGQGTTVTLILPAPVGRAKLSAPRRRGLRKVT